MAQFKRGRSGNPRGRPVGSTHTSKIRNLLASHSDKLVNQAISLALEGDTTALKICLERICPALKSKDEPVKLTGLSDSATLPEQGAAYIRAMGEGKLTPTDTSAMVQALANQARLVELSELEKRVAALEE